MLEFPFSRSTSTEAANRAKERCAKESKSVDFKERIDLTQPEGWCEIIKDLVAMANSGGGSILVGVRDDGTPSGWNPSDVLATDPAIFVDKIARYTGEQFSDFEIVATKCASSEIAELRVSGSATPIVFTRPGTYESTHGKSKTAFQQGTVYFRHGAKSEPGNSQDLREFIERRIECVRRDWLGNIKKVVTAPPGARVEIFAPADRVDQAQGPVRVRIVEDSTAPLSSKLNPDTHPYRQKEVVERIAKRLDKRVTSFDMQCIRKAYQIDETKPQYYHKPKFASPQYSDAFIDWTIAEFQKNPQFFEAARAVCKSSRT